MKVVIEYQECTNTHTQFSWIMQSRSRSRCLSLDRSIDYKKRTSMFCSVELLIYNAQINSSFKPEISTRQQDINNELFIILKKKYSMFTKLYLS
jgi:hypothetical protein